MFKSAVEHFCESWAPTLRQTFAAVSPGHGVRAQHLHLVKPCDVHSGFMTSWAQWRRAEVLTEAVKQQDVHNMWNADEMGSVVM